MLAAKHQWHTIYSQDILVGGDAKEMKIKAYMGDNGTLVVTIIGESSSSQYIPGAYIENDGTDLVLKC